MPTAAPARNSAAAAPPRAADGMVPFHVGAWIYTGVARHRARLRGAAPWEQSTSGGVNHPGCEAKNPWSRTAPVRDHGAADPARVAPGVPGAI